MVAAAKLSPSPSKISRNAGARRGTLSAFVPPHAHTLEQQVSERILSQGRSADITANDWAANSGVNAISINTVGTGLRPQSRINARRLGISRDAALQLQEDIETVWREWTAVAHVRGMLHFEDLQFLGLRTMLRMGEMLHLPVKVSEPGRKIALALQDVLPTRLRTPRDKITDPTIVDGVERNAYGVPSSYWLATPSADYARVIDFASLASDQFTRMPARVAHRPGCFHLFRHTEEEQVRGESIFSPGMNLYRHLSDALDNELLAAVTTAAMSMFVAKETGTGAVPNWARPADGDLAEQDEGDKTLYEEIKPGTVMYGNQDEKPYMLDSGRPSPNFAVFSEFVLRAMAATIDMPYEVLAKDFSKTNYSSARAALLEAWRVFMFYRSWLTRHYCHPIWEMVIEEAWLAGMIKLPSGAPDFYDARSLYTKALWIGPPRGYVDPVKEVSATVQALENKLMTYSEALAERGRDFDETMDEREEEEQRLSKLSTRPTKPSTFKDEPHQEDPNASV